MFDINVGILLPFFIGGGLVILGFGIVGIIRLVKLFKDILKRFLG